ncbi:MAG: ABC transporter substrate-binding protein, partial [Brevinematia bacterium]
MKLGKFLIFIGIIFMVVSLSSCGGGGNKLVFMYWGSPEEKEVVLNYINQFTNQNPNVEIEGIHVDSLSFGQKLKTMIAGGTPPDVFYLDIEDFSGLASRGELLQLDDFVNKDAQEVNVSDFFEAPFNEFKYKGKLYGIAKDFTTLVLYYNIDLFDKYGIGYPNDNWTWDDFLNASKKLTKDLNGDGVIDQYGFVIETWANWWRNWVYANGGTFFDESGKFVLGKQPYLKANAEAIQFLADLINVHKVAPKISASRDFGGGEAMFVDGRAGMAAYGRWATLRFRDITKFKWNVAQMPKGKVRRASTLFTVAYCIHSKTKNPELAWKLVKFLSSPQIQKDVAESGLAIPIRKSVAYSDAFLKAPAIVKNQPQVDSKVYLDALQYVTDFKRPVKWVEIRDILDEYMQKILNNDMKAEPALKELQLDVEDL